MTSYICAECWKISDGNEICAHEPVDWLMVWWFWFVIILFLYACVGTGKYYSHQNTAKNAVNIIEEDTRGTPLLDVTAEKKIAISYA
jgi:hypothetical protein